MDTEILSRLYNLRGEDSVRLKDIKIAKSLATEKKDFATHEIEELINTVDTSEKMLKAITLEGWDLNDFLTSAKKDKWSTVLRELKISFEPDILKSSLEEALPKKIEETENKINEAKKRLEVVTKDEKDAEEEITGIDFRYDEEHKKQKKLNEIIEESLTEGGINMTPPEVKKFLASLEVFSEDEQYTLARELSYPKDNLIPFDESIKMSEGKNIAAVIGEAVDAALDPVDINPPILGFESPPVDTQGELDEIKEFLTEVGIGYQKFSTCDWANIKSAFDKAIVATNLEYSRNKGIYDGMYYQNPALLVDPNTALFIDFILIDLEKTANDINHNIRVFADCSLEDLMAIKEECPKLGFNARDLPLSLLSSDSLLGNFLDNVRFITGKNLYIGDIVSKNAFKFACNNLESTKYIYEVLIEFYGLDNISSHLELFAASPYDLKRDLESTRIQEDKDPEVTLGGGL